MLDARARIVTMGGQDSARECRDLSLVLSCKALRNLWACDLTSDQYLKLWRSCYSTAYAYHSVFRQEEVV